MIFVFTGEVSAYGCCDAYELSEKTSIERLQHTGLIIDSKIKSFYLERFGSNLEPDVDYEVYVSAMHSGGAGHYEISKVDVDGKNVVLWLDFVVGVGQRGAAVMNQRVLFFKIKSGCKIAQIMSSYK